MYEIHITQENSVNADSAFVSTPRVLMIKQLGIDSDTLTDGIRIRMSPTYRRCLISALKLASAAWKTPFLVMSSSFSSAAVRSPRLSFPSMSKFKAWEKSTQECFVFPLKIPLLCAKQSQINQ